MIGEVFFDHHGVSRPAYVLDCLGNLIRCSARGDADALIPFAVELVTAASEILAPFPWTVTIKAVLSRVEFVAHAHPKLRSAYPGLSIIQSPWPFVLHIGLIEDESLVWQAIDAFPTLPDSQAKVLSDKLAENGIFQIPALPNMNDALHEAAGDGICVAPIAYVAPGWMSSMKIYRRALVRSS